MNKIAFCVTGWHFSAVFYTQIKAIPGVDLFVVSHQPRESIPEAILEILPAEKLLIKPNYGYDWGCFQQFLETNLWQAYDYLFFMHDDIRIVNPAFVQACIKLLEQGYSVVGNGQPFTKKDWPKTHTAYYAHAAWQLPSLNFEHAVVRGSFFATRKEVLTKMKSFEVFWDRLRLTIGFGNYSLMATSGKFGEIFGEKAFVFLAETYRASPYIIEFERGEDTTEDQPTKENKDQRYLLNHLFMPWFNRLSTAYVLSTFKTETRFSDQIIQQLRKKIINLFAI